MSFSKLQRLFVQFAKWLAPHSHFDIIIQKLLPSQPAPLSLPFRQSQPNLEEVPISNYSGMEIIQEDKLYISNDSMLARVILFQWINLLRSVYKYLISK